MSLKLSVRVLKMLEPMKRSAAVDYRETCHIKQQSKSHKQIYHNFQHSRHSMDNTRRKVSVWKLSRCSASTHRMCCCIHISLDIFFLPSFCHSYDLYLYIFFSHSETTMWDLPACQLVNRRDMFHIVLLKNGSFLFLFSVLAHSDMTCVAEGDWLVSSQSGTSSEKWLHKVKPLPLVKKKYTLLLWLYVILLFCGCDCNIYSCKKACMD